ncbi:MAG: hypothetical protein KA764_00150 [Anaerolineales bacterium]|nr:hypothetical protein [Anaerolineales bacterium]
MDTLGKLELLSGQMSLEPAEETVGLRPPANPAPRALREAGPGYAAGPDPGQQGRAPCGHSPAELRATLNTLTRGSPDPAPSLERKKHSLGVSYAAMPGGKRIALLKTLLTSACERDCFYCPFRARRNFRRATFKPDEMAGLFNQMHRAGVAEGLFLSSGIAAGGVRTQDRLIDTAEILRRRHAFRGYLHLKLMPGLERDQLLRAMQLANRVSINLEAPNTERLRRLAPHKVFIEELLQPLQWADEIRRTRAPQDTLFGRWPSLVTQMVVGGAEESDLEILTTTAHLTQRLRLARVYFSAFHPVPETPLEHHPPEDPWREHRLYQASFLLRDYGFELEDMPFTAEHRLPLDRDPKQAWAELNLRETPVEVNRAERRELLRVPGLGPKGVDAILAARRRGTLRELRDLRALGVLADRAAPFVLLDGRAPARQLRLF